MSTQPIKAAVLAGAATAGLEYAMDDGYGEYSALKCGAIGAGSSLVGGTVSNMVGLPPKAGPALMSGLTFASIKAVTEEDSSFIKDLLIGTGVTAVSNAVVNRANLYPGASTYLESGAGDITSDMI